MTLQEYLEEWNTGCAYFRECWPNLEPFHPIQEIFWIFVAAGTVYAVIEWKIRKNRL